MSTKQISLIILKCIILSVVLPLQQCLALSLKASDWEILNIPGDLNKDKSIHIYSGQAQALTFRITTNKANIKYATDIKLIWKLPVGTKLLDANNTLTKTPPISYKHLKDEKNNSLFKVEFKQPTNSLGEIGKRFRGEWKNFQMAIVVPNSASRNTKAIVSIYINGSFVKKHEWNMTLKPVPQSIPELKYLRIGLWDYGVFRLSKATKEIINFYLNVGINYNQMGFYDFTKDKSLSGKFTFGGSVHRSGISNRKHLDVRHTGKIDRGGFITAQALIEHGPAVIEKQIDKMIKKARALDNIILFDYEPYGFKGFNEPAINAFLKHNNISRSDFDSFGEEYKKVGHKMYLTKDKSLMDIYLKWTAFRTKQSQDFAKIIYKEIKRKAPDIQFEISCTRTFGDNDISTISSGANNAAMSKYLDVIMPQLYTGYDGAAAKYVAWQAKQWKKEVQSLNKNCKLIPVLLVRYCGVKPNNSPEMVRLQTLGSIAEGSLGAVYYFAQNLNRDYFESTAKTARDLSKTEEFYVKGQRVDSRYEPQGMLKGKTEKRLHPGFSRIINNPSWHWTAHSLGGKVLLTLFNYSGNDIMFSFNMSINPQKIWNCKQIKSSRNNRSAFIVPPEEVGFIILNNGVKKQKNNSNVTDETEIIADF